MKFLIYSKCGEGAGLGLRLKQEGNDVSILIKEREYRSVYDGILKKVKVVPDDAIVVFDSSGMGGEADTLRHIGNKVFGAGKFADKLESDRKFGLDFMRKHGIEIPKTYNFTCVDDALEFIDTTPGDYVFKPCGDLPSKLTYKPCDPEDLARYMQFVDESYDLTEFVLQEVVEGAPLSTEYFCGSRGFVGRPSHTIEVKKFMDGDLGPSTGCSGNTVWADIDEASDPVTKLLKKTEMDLVRQKYIGPIDLNAMVSPEGIYGLEWTPRFGLDAMPTWLQLVKGDVGEIIVGLIDGSLKEIDLSGGFASGVRVTIPPYPIEPESLKLVHKESPNYGVPIRGFTGHEDSTYFYEVLENDYELFHSAGTGVIAVVSCVGSDVEDSFERPYEILEEVKIPDKQYRTDLAKVIGKMHEEVCSCLEAHV